MRRRRLIAERRSCWQCQGDFRARYTDEVYCSPRCGWLARCRLAVATRIPRWARIAA